MLIILKICSQRAYMLKQLRDQGLPLQKLHTVFQAILLSRLMYSCMRYQRGPWGGVHSFQLPECSFNL